MGRSATTFTLTVQAAGDSAIAQFVSGQASNTFSADFGPTSGINEPLSYDGGVNPSGVVPAFNADNGQQSNYTILDWTGRALWDGANWWYTAGTTGAFPGSSTVVRYSVSDNTWRHWQGQTAASIGPYGTAGQSHNFEGAGYSPSRKKIYRLMQQTYAIGWFDVENLTGGAFPITYTSPYFSAEVFEDIGQLVVLRHEGYTTSFWHSLDDGSLVATRPFPSTINKPAVCYLNGRVYFTGADNTSFYYYGTTGNPVPAAATPQIFNTNGTTTDHTLLTPMGGYIYAFRLAPGATGRGVYRYDPTLDQWSGNLTTTFPAFLNQRWTVGAIPTEGVVMVVGQPVSDTVATCHLWKP